MPIEVIDVTPEASSSDLIEIILRHDLHGSKPIGTFKPEPGSPVRFFLTPKFLIGLVAERLSADLRVDAWFVTKGEKMIDCGLAANLSDEEPGKIVEVGSKFVVVAVDRPPLV